MAGTIRNAGTSSRSLHADLRAARRARAQARREAAKADPKEALVEALCKELGFDGAQAQNRDSLDFRDCAVWTVADALRRAYEAGRAAK